MNILFITHTRIGDAILSSGILKRLVDQHPGAQITIACGPLAASLFREVPGLERIVVVTKQPLDGHWFKLWREVRAKTWDLVVDLRRSLVSYFLKARERRILGPADDSVHRVRYLSSVLGQGQVAPPSLFTNATHAAAARALIPDGPPVLAVSPVAATAAKTWPAEKFAQAVVAATAAGGPCAGWRVALFGAPADRSAAQALLAAVPGTLAIFDQPDLLTVHGALGRCARFIGNDSGLAHLAAAAGVPSLAIFGPTDPTRYAPWGGHSVRAASGLIADLDVASVMNVFREMPSR